MKEEKEKKGEREARGAREERNERGKKECSLGWPPDFFGYLPLWQKIQRQTIFSDSIQSRSAKYLL